MAMFAPGLSGTSARQAAGMQPHNELTLAGLRPGRSKLPKDAKMLGFRGPSTSDDTGVYWSASCYGDMLHVQENTERIVQTITASLLGPQAGDCMRSDAKLRREMRAGRGLELGDPCGRVTQLYGEPESRGPSARGARKLELLFYSFDWAGDDVPQSMEVSCDPSSGQVVEITLAASTL
jgi:hypothetical protein